MMFLKVCELCEALGANIAFEGSLAGVRPQVRKYARTRMYVAASVARRWHIEISICALNFHVMI
ncbi:hypothetical protein PUN28_010663 [Cardiocondyla obscurior]|uniref:Uncharacterized protein n=1 Tax=Cardiocondyla obscurior TaxID=286306 RepID=A0AAW2FJ68_9HYME